MKTKQNLIIRKILFLPVFILLLITVSCQNEESITINPPQEDTVDSNSVTANLMSRTASNDGSLDNIIDYANCLEVVLPVTVIANGETLIIQSVADFDALEAVLDAYNTDDDVVEIIFPITVILNDYTELVLNNQNELNLQIANCNDENEDDEDIECIDFEYPISFSTYNINFQFLDTVVIEDDQSLYNFINALDNSVLATINFPITLITSEEEVIIVNSNEELNSALNEYDGLCDEDDDYDYNDDDEDPFECYTINLSTALESCDYDGDGVAIFNIYEAVPNCALTDPVSIFFYLSLEGAETQTDFLSGATSYENITTNQTIYIRVTLTNSPEIFQIYPVDLVVNDCTTPCSEQQVNQYLQECVWNVVSIDGSDELIIYEFDFGSNGDLLITNTSNNNAEYANWLVFSSSSTGQLILGFTNINNTGLSAIYGNWGLVACDYNRLEFNNWDNSVMVLEQDCN
ncbi:MAG: hypothetical protein WBF67_07930 [Olleya sp.]